MPLVPATDVELKIKTAPPGSILSEGRLKWREIDESNQTESRLEKIIIQAEDECGGGRELFSLYVNISSCPCGDHGECQVLVTGHHNDSSVLCNCQPGYHGETILYNIDINIDIYCVIFIGELCDMIDNPCVRAECGHGTCVVTGQETFNCVCDEGFTGEHCDAADEERGVEKSLCDPSPCYPGVECSTEDWFFTCAPCPPGLTGDGITCVVACNDVLCDHETVTLQSTLTNEITGDEASDCSDNITLCFTDHCLSSPCYPGVSCSSLASSYSCGPCPPGMTGDGVSCIIDHCAEHDPCFDGVTCYNSRDRAKCGNCPPGYEGNGIKCTAARDPCASSPCYHGVQCVNVRMGQSTGYVCGLCPEGMEGDGEECHDVDSCSHQPCHPGVVCTAHTDGSHSCGPCPPGMTGDGVTCTTQCAPDSCYPGVVCSVVDSGPECGVCPPGTRGDGRHCSDIDDCSPSPCYPGVQCTDKSAPARGYSCAQCPGDMVGDGINCVTPALVQCPQSLSCHALAQCHQLPGDDHIRCSCHPGLTGDGVHCSSHNATSQPSCSRKCQ